MTSTYTNFRAEFSLDTTTFSSMQPIQAATEVLLVTNLNLADESVHFSTIRITSEEQFIMQKEKFMTVWQLSLSLVGGILFSVWSFFSTLALLGVLITLSLTLRYASHLITVKHLET